MSSGLVAQNAALVLALMTGLWAVSVARRDASIVDPFWSVAFLVVTVHTVARTGITPAKVLLLVLVAAWALRLFLHLLWRSRGKPEDPRYAAFRRHFGAERYWWVSFFQVFLLQGLLVVLISTPLQLVAAAPPPHPITALHALGALVFAVGFAFEAIADHQLVAFRSDPSRRGQVLDTGLWRFSRHPNYFGEALLGWGLWILALDQPHGWASALAPAVMTWLLVKVSGVAMLDRLLSRTRPGYADYMARTPGFIPRPWPWRARRKV